LELAEAEVHDAAISVMVRGRPSASKCTMAQRTGLPKAARTTGGWSWETLEYAAGSSRSGRFRLFLLNSLIFQQKRWLDNENSRTIHRV
jgi:hypothetical protein